MRYEFDPTKAQATIEVFPKGQYEFTIGEPKSFIRKNQQGEDSYGVRYPITIQEPSEFKGKRTVMTCYMHSDGAQGFSKQFLMAALGYQKTDPEEKKFNEDTRGLDWGIDPESGGVGDGWRQLTGKRVIGDLDIGKNKETGDPQQQFKGWRTLNGGR